MSWFFRVVELGDGTWVCRHGRRVFDTHTAKAEAIDHIMVLAAMDRPAEVFLHRVDGSVESLGSC